MGAFCTKAAIERTASEITLSGYGLKDYMVAYESQPKAQNMSRTMSMEGPAERRLERDRFSSSGKSSFGSSKSSDVEPRFSSSSSHKSKSTSSKSSTSSKIGSTKVMEVSSFLGRAVGFGKAVEVLDTLGSSMTSLNSGSGFGSGVSTKGNKIYILAFEVANTIVKGATLMQSLSREKIKHLKEVVLLSEGVQHLISTDLDELLQLVAADKREELRVFSREVVRFGNRCKDPQWHNLDRYFAKLESEFTPQEQLKEVAPITMQYLMSLVPITAELYHNLHALDRFQQDYQRKLREEGSPLSVQRGESFQILKQELKSQRKSVEDLKRRSLWSKILEEVMEKLVDIVHFLHLEIHDAFDVADDGDKAAEGANNSHQTLGSSHQRLGSAGLALHYANIITQIDSLVLRSSSVPANTRDTLYQGLPSGIKNALRAKLHLFQIKEELTVPQIKAEMEKSLQWLVPIANNTIRSHHGFGWVGEWANMGAESSRRPVSHSDLIKIETLHYASKEKTEAYILELVVWLHHLISQYKPSNAGMRSPVKSPLRSPLQRRWTVSPLASKGASSSSNLTQEDKEMLQEANLRKLTPGRSKSLEFYSETSRLSKHDRLSKSSSYFLTNTLEFSSMRHSIGPVVDFDIDRIKALDVIDRVDSIN